MVIKLISREPAHSSSGTNWGPAAIALVTNTGCGSYNLCNFTTLHTQGRVGSWEKLELEITPEKKVDNLF